MPKLDSIYLIERLKKRIKQIESGEVIEARDINVLLSSKQKKQLSEAWKKQKEIRKKFPYFVKFEKKKEIGWKTKNEIKLEILKIALKELDDDILESLNIKIKSRNSKQAKIYLRKYYDELSNGVDKLKAKLRANNELTRHGLLRVDRMENNMLGLNKRAKEVREIEDNLRKRFELEDKEGQKK